MPNVQLGEEAVASAGTAATTDAPAESDHAAAVSRGESKGTATPDESTRSDGEGADVQSRPAAQRTGLFAVTGVAIASLALLVAVAMPFWAPRVVVNDPQTARLTTVAVAQLSNAIASGQPFEGNLMMVRAAVPVLDDDLDRLLDGLRVHAPLGLSTLAALQRGFEAEANLILVHKVTGNADRDWLNWTAGKIASAIRLESVVAGVSSPETAEEIETLREIAAALRAGDVANAVAAVDMLSMESKQGLSAWRVEAVRHLALTGYRADLPRMAERRASRGAYVALPW